MSNSLMLYSLKAGAFLARVIPRRIGIKLAYALGYFFGLLPTKVHTRIARVQHHITPELTRSQLRTRVARVCASYAGYWWDVFWMTTPRSNEDINRIVAFENRHYLDEAAERSRSHGKGIILALPHLGSWEIAGTWLARQGCSPYVVAERLSPPELFELFTKTRTDAGMHVIAHDDHPTRQLLSVLNEGHVICLVADRDLSRRGHVVPFFTGMKSFPTGPAALARKTGATLLPVCTYVSHDGHITIAFSAPLEVSESEESSTERVTEELATIFEEMISRDPSAWHVLHDEWEK